MKLIFVYNAKSGLGNHVLDALHKSLSPKTYNCDLCSLTYGHVGPRKEWKEFLRSLDMKFEFHYKDKFAAAHPFLNDDYPVIYLKDKNNRVLVSANEMNECKNIEGLIEKIKINLTGLG